MTPPRATREIAAARGVEPGSDCVSPASHSEFRTPIEMLLFIDRLRTQVGRLDFAPEELEGKRQVSALFKTMFLAFRAGGARDFADYSGSKRLPEGLYGAAGGG